MAKPSGGLCLAGLCLLAIVVVVIADTLIAEGDGDGPPSVIATLKTEEGFPRPALQRHPRRCDVRLRNQTPDHQGRGRMAARNAPRGYPRPTS